MIITETRNVPAFSSIILNGKSTVRIHKGPQSIQITMDGDLIERYETKVKNNTLMIGLKCGIGYLKALKSMKTCEVDITVPELDGITINGLGTITVDAFSYERLKIDLNGAGSIELQGAVSELTVLCSGAGNILASDLTAKVGVVKLSGSCSVKVRVEEDLNASVTGAGEIIYWGNPNITQNITGTGSIRHADE